MITQCGVDGGTGFFFGPFKRVIGVRRAQIDFVQVVNDH